MAFVYLTKPTRTGTGRPHQQKSRRSLGVALSPVRAPPFFTNSVNISLLNNFLYD